jgi:hypothetical protein
MIEDGGPAMTVGMSTITQRRRKPPGALELTLASTTPCERLVRGTNPR